MKKAGKEFGADWPREELLAYDINGYVLSTLACIELLQESKPKLNPRDAKLWNIIEQSMRAARPKAQELTQLFYAQRKGEAHHG
jgi:hypothetical protein